MASTGSSKAMDLLDQFTSLAGENATTANIKAASAYADNPYTQGMIDANSRDVVRNLNEETLPGIDRQATRSEEHTSELQSLMRISYAVFCLKKKKNLNKMTPSLYSATSLIVHT